jgi:hypothetical protein
MRRKIMQIAHTQQFHILPATPEDSNAFNRKSTQNMYRRASHCTKKGRKATGGVYNFSLL